MTAAWKIVPGELAKPVVPDFDHDTEPDGTDQDDDTTTIHRAY